VEEVNWPDLKRRWPDFRIGRREKMKKKERRGRRKSGSCCVMKMWLIPRNGI
jgi:hypothetical protein